MKTISERILIILFLVLSTRCEKEPNPNENWIAGMKWIDKRDGHPYSTIPIGDQVWMAENLAFLPFVNNVDYGSEDEGKEEEPFYYVYDYNGTNISDAKTTSNYGQYGVLYNYNAALEACPDGWHLPTDVEWMNLEIFLGLGPFEAGSEGFRGAGEGSWIKSTWGWEFNTWTDKYGNGTNETGFTAAPGGSRWNGDNSYPGEFGGSPGWGNWWSATQITYEQRPYYAWVRILSFSRDDIGRSMENIDYALSVRCIKN